MARTCDVLKLLICEVVRELTCSESIATILAVSRPGNWLTVNADTWSDRSAATWALVIWRICSVPRA